MKRFVSVILILTLLILSTVAYSDDYTSMTEEQLKKEFDLIRNELIVKGLKAENKTVICDKKGIKIYINGDIKTEKQYVWDELPSLYLPVVLINDSSFNAEIIVKNASVNGWSTDSSDDLDAVPAGKKAKGNFIFSLKETDVESLADFTDVEFNLRLYDDNTWEDIFITDPISVYANK